MTNNFPTGTNPTNAITLSSPSLSETNENLPTFQDMDSDSEGGMQLDPPELDQDDFDFEQAHGQQPRINFTAAEIEYETHALEETRDGMKSLFIQCFSLTSPFIFQSRGIETSIAILTYIPRIPI